MKIIKWVLVVIKLLVFCLQASGEYKTANFIVHASSPQFEKAVGDAAEVYRHELAIEWLGQPLAGDWYRPCPVHCKTGEIGAGGMTSFTFIKGEVHNWHMTLQGSEQRILDSVLPHEISHAIFASHFRRPLPRWIDEGAATSVECDSERQRQISLLNQVMETQTWIPTTKLVRMTEYPQDDRYTLSLYAQGYSLTQFLIDMRGRRALIEFMGDAFRSDWSTAIKTHYGFDSLDTATHHWTEYRRRGHGVGFQVWFGCPNGACPTYPPYGRLPQGGNIYMPWQQRPQNAVPIRPSVNPYPQTQPQQNAPPTLAQPQPTYPEPVSQPQQTQPEPQPTPANLVTAEEFHQAITEIKTSIASIQVCDCEETSEVSTDAPVIQPFERNLTGCGCENCRCQGCECKDGEDGRGIVSIELIEASDRIYHLYATYSDQTTDTVGQIEVPDGKLTDAEIQTIVNLVVSKIKVPQVDIDFITKEVIKRIDIGDPYEPPDPKRHVVVIGDPNGLYYNNLKRDVEKTKTYFDQIELIDPPTDRNVGTLPALVLYVDGKSALTKRGTSDVRTQLSRIRRGEFD